MRILILATALSFLAEMHAEKVYTITSNEPLAQAIERARKERGNEPVRIVLRGGRYELSEPLALNGNDSEMTLMAAPGERPVISGGRQIHGWKRDARKPNLWTVEIPPVRDGKWEFRQLFINGQRKTRAKTPNTGFFRIQGPSPQDKPVRLRFHGNDIRPDYAGRGIEAIALLAWADIRMQIVEVNAQEHVATLSGDPRPSNKENEARYYLENSREFLDAVGEWFLDLKSGVLSYLAGEGEDLAKAEAIAPVLEDLVLINGTAENPVRNIRFEGLEFSHTNWKLGSNGYADTQAAVAVHGDVLARYSRDVAIENCRFSHLAGYALELGVGCQKFRVVGNEMVDIGGGGIRIGETSIPSGAAEENHTHVVTDNEMHQLGRVYPPAVGVFIMQSGTNRIAHNHIHDLYYTAVSVGWNWGYRETPCRENIIEFNHLHDIGQEILSDMGAVYTLGIQKGTVIRNNLIHDVRAFNYGGWGLYPDEGSTGIVLENNIVFRCKDAGFHQHYGRENIVRNNIFAFNQKNQLMRTRAEPHSSFTFTTNIVLFDSGNLLGSNWSNDNYVMDRNLYFDTRQPDLKFAGASRAEWVKRGHDRHSVVADPMFVDAAKGNFELREGSPALLLGFKPIDVKRAGVRPPEVRQR